MTFQVRFAKTSSAPELPKFEETGYPGGGMVSPHSLGIFKKNARGWHGRNAGEEKHAHPPQPGFGDW